MNWDGEGDWGSYYLGVGGACATMGYDPPAGYWCTDPPRGISPPGSASGVFVTPSLLPNAFGDPASGNKSLSYRDRGRGAIVHAWRPAHWYTNMWRVGEAAYSGAGTAERATAGATAVAIDATTAQTVVKNGSSANSSSSSRICVNLIFIFIYHSHVSFRF